MPNNAYFLERLKIATAPGDSAPNPPWCYSHLQI